MPTYVVSSSEKESVRREPTGCLGPGIATLERFDIATSDLSVAVSRCSPLCEHAVGSVQLGSRRRSGPISVPQGQRAVIAPPVARAHVSWLTSNRALPNRLPSLPVESHLGPAFDCWTSVRGRLPSAGTGWQASPRTGRVGRVAMRARPAGRGVMAYRAACLDTLLAQPRPMVAVAESPSRRLRLEDGDWNALMVAPPVIARSLGRCTLTDRLCGGLVGRIGTRTWGSAS